MALTCSNCAFRYLRFIAITPYSYIYTNILKQ
ncbi:hypothetical protein Deiofobo_0368 [Pseudomonas phage Deifobo]|nr:hypothetical protein Deiofobo_0368 [Pseudomonas phage Deifobo]